MVGMITRGSSKFAILWLLVVLSSSGTYTFGGIINGAQYITYYNFTVPEPSTTVACVFGVQNIQYSNTIMFASTSPITITLTRQSISEMYLNLSSLLSNMDLFGAINGDLQLVNLRYSYANNNKVYLAFFNLDQPTSIADKQYYLSFRTVTTTGLICFSCPWGSSLSFNCQCSPCDNNRYGKQCNYYVEPMTEGQPYYANMYSITNSYYRIDSPPERVKIVYSEDFSTNSIKLYVQFQNFPGDLAGDLNTYYDSMNVSLSKLVTTAESEFVIESKGRRIMLTLHSTSSFHSTNVALKFQNADGKSKLGLILGLSLGFLVVIVSIVVFCYCRKKRQIRRLTENSFYLSTKEINLYFPEVKGSVVLSYLKKIALNYDKLMVNESESRTDKNDEQQCVICLTPITNSCTVRVIYCKHIFHSHCLISWFSKNQNCPFCRHQCNREPSEIAYQQFTRGRASISAENLVRMVLQLDYNFKPKKVIKSLKEKALQGSFDIEDQNEYSGQNNYDDGSEESQSRQSSHRHDFSPRKKRPAFKGKNPPQRAKGEGANPNENSHLHLNS